MNLRGVEVVTIYPNVQETKELIKQLVSIPSPTGFTANVIQYTEEYLQKLDVKTKRIRKGGLLATIPGANDEEHRFLTAHVDTLGAMVKEVKSNGRLKLDLIGGFPYNYVEGEYCKIHTSSGSVLTGTILMHQTSVHVYRNTGKTERNQDNMEVRIDAEVDNAEAVRNLGIEVGDFVSFDPRVELTDNGFIKSRHLDDKV